MFHRTNLNQSNLSRLIQEPALLKWISCIVLIQAGWSWACQVHKWNPGWLKKKIFNNFLAKKWVKNSEINTSHLSFNSGDWGWSFKGELKLCVSLLGIRSDLESSQVQQLCYLCKHSSTHIIKEEALKNHILRVKILEVVDWRSQNLY